MGSLFGGDEPALDALRAGRDQAAAAVQNFKPVGFTGGGLRGTFSNNQFNIRPTAARNQTIGGIQSTFNQQAEALRGQRDDVRPGFGRLTTSRLQEVENARRRSIGNLQENLARRRVLGSSFGQDALTRAELEFAQEAESAAAESFVQELELTNQLINQEFEASRGAFQTQLDQMNLEAGLAAELSKGASTIMAALTKVRAEGLFESAQEEAKLIKEGQAGKGEFFGQLGSTLGGALGTAVGGPIGGQLGSALGSAAGTAFA